MRRTKILPADETTLSGAGAALRRFRLRTARPGAHDLPRRGLPIRFPHDAHGRRGLASDSGLRRGIPPLPGAAGPLGRRYRGARARRLRRHPGRRIPSRNRPRPHRRPQRRLRRGLQRRAGALPAAAARNLREARPARRDRDRLCGNAERPALRIPRNDARRGPDVDGCGCGKALYRPAFIPQYQQTASSSHGRRRMAHRDPFPPRTGRGRRIPRRRFAREGHLRQMVRTLRRLLHAGGDARHRPLCRRPQHRGDPRDRPPGAQPHGRDGASRNPLRLRRRHGSHRRIRLPQRLVRGARGELRAARGYSGRNLRTLPVGIHPYRRRRGGHVAVEAVPGLPGAHGPDGNGRPAPAGGPLPGAARGYPARARQAARRLERSRAHGRLFARLPRERLGEHEGVPRCHGQRLPDRRDAGRVFLFRHAAVAERAGPPVGGDLRRPEGLFVRLRRSRILRRADAPRRGFAGGFFQRTLRGARAGEARLPRLHALPAGLRAGTDRLERQRRGVGRIL